MTRWSTRWPLWQLNGRAVAYLLGVEVLTAISCVTYVAVSAAWDTTALSRLAILLLVGVVYTEVTDRVERMWTWLHTDRGAWAGQEAVLLFAGVCVLPTWAALVQCVVVYAHYGVRCSRYKTQPAHRWIWTGTTVLQATAVASGLLHFFGGQLGQVGVRDAALLGLAFVAYSGVNLVVLLSGMYLALRPPKIAALVPARREVAYQTFQLLLGLVGAVLIVHAPLLTPVTLVMAAMLQRSSMVSELVADATTDAKTGLLTAKAWRDAASRNLGSAARSGHATALLVLDLDHFKLVNDSHGHMAGDKVLAAVGEVLAAEIRNRDAVGRYGGEEFVVILDDTDQPAALEVADRLRRRIASIEAVPGVRVTASVGVAMQHDADAELDTLLVRADCALYEAKAAGRDAVRAAVLTA